MDTKIKNPRVNNIMIGSGLVLLAVAGGLWARKLWTDYNDHDPGITGAELLAYSIEDASYAPKKGHSRQRKLRKDD